MGNNGPVFNAFILAVVSGNRVLNWGIKLLDRYGVGAKVQKIGTESILWLNISTGSNINVRCIDVRIGRQDYYGFYMYFGCQDQGLDDVCCNEEKVFEEKIHVERIIRNG